VGKIPDGGGKRSRHILVVLGCVAIQVTTELRVSSPFSPFSPMLIAEVYLMLPLSDTNNHTNLMDAMGENIN
jgi:hypothetical protein